MILAAEILEGLGYISEESRDAIIDVLRKGL
jgi:hypothetical protein